MWKIYSPHRRIESERKRCHVVVSPRISHANKAVNIGVVKPANDMKVAE
jgi:hypothetical protein